MEENGLSAQDSMEPRPPDVVREPPPVPEGEAHTCSTCGHGAVMSDAVSHGSNVYPPYVYAVGRIEPRMPSIGVEKEFAQAVGRAETVDLTDRQALVAVLSEPRNHYLVRQLCYVMTVQGLDTYLLRPRDPGDLPQLVEALGEAPRSTDLHVVIGLRGPLAPPDYCNGLMLPVVAFEQIYTFSPTTFVQSLPKPNGIAEDQFRATAEELFERVIQIADNAGSADEHRAVNYLAVRYPNIYAKCAEAHSSGASLTAIETRPSRLSGVRRILDVIFSFTDRTTDVTEKFFVRVDVDEVFPHLITKLSPYYDR
ncbi:hypothetical protein N4P33_28140 [Streptomyces sp. 15-116A]|uniref:cyanobactin maturation protease PatG family protein n=1 Tax=Streptomyces sp. 15-116A TaxID=2259035 RepID=UPI0021B24BF8|nr:hypothetical protein [Streptomyces sp. 15-116A]MCT7355993.1 hypothetical protein [Streptomyces sp. 15-116A]